MLRRWDFRLVPSERSLEAVGESVRLHIISRSKVFDLFPRTYKGKNRCVSRRKHALINSRERPLKSDINLEQSSQTERIEVIYGKKDFGFENRTGVSGQTRAFERGGKTFRRTADGMDR